MSGPAWPWPLVRQRLIEHTRTDTVDGYWFDMTVGTAVAGGPEMVQRTRGTVHHHDWGCEEVLELSTENTPSLMPAAHVPQRIERTLVRRGKRGERFVFAVRDRVVLGDGTVELHEDLMAFDDDPTRADLSEAEIAERLTAVFQGGASLAEQFGRAEILDEGDDPSA